MPNISSARVRIVTLSCMSPVVWPNAEKWAVTPKRTARAGASSSFRAVQPVDKSGLVAVSSRRIKGMIRTRLRFKEHRFRRQPVRVVFQDAKIDDDQPFG